MRSRIPDHWEEWIKDFVHAKSDGERSHLNAYDFTGSVRISFPDGSFAFFDYAFCVIDEDRHELAVFTEHCGYHVFPLEELHFTQLHSVAKWERGQTG